MTARRWRILLAALSIVLVLTAVTAAMSDADAGRPEARAASHKALPAPERAAPPVAVQAIPDPGSATLMALALLAVWRHRDRIWAER